MIASSLCGETGNKITQINKVKPLNCLNDMKTVDLRYHKNVEKIANILFCCLLGLTFCSEIFLTSKSFNLSTLHCILTSCPTLRPSEGRGRKPTARHGSSTGLCKVIALLKINSCPAPSTPVDLFMKGGWAPIVLSPEIPYFIFNMLSGCSPVPSAFFFKQKKEISRLILEIRL